MESNDPALRGTAATPELWAGVYMMLVFALLSRALHALNKYDGKTFGWQQGVEIAVELLFCPAPLLMGLSFRNLIRNERNYNRLSQRAYKVCNFWLAKLLIIAYIAMIL
ncbi:MAG: hypothetical protein ACLPY1_06205 [Terracidiphilus sp.]